MPLSELELAERLAKSTNRRLSGAVREGLKRLAFDHDWQQVHAVARPKAEALGISANDVNRLVGEYRREKPSKAAAKKKSR